MTEQPSVIINNTEISRVVTNNNSPGTYQVSGPAPSGGYVVSDTRLATMASLADVSTVGRMKNDVLKYDSTIGKWKTSAGWVVLGEGESPTGLRPGTLIFRENNV